MIPMLEDDYRGFWINSHSACLESDSTSGVRALKAIILSYTSFQMELAFNIG